MRALALLAAALLLTVTAAEITYSFNPSSSTGVVGDLVQATVTVTGCDSIPTREAPDNGTPALAPGLETDPPCDGTVTLTNVGVGSFTAPSRRDDTNTLTLNTGQATFFVTSTEVGTSVISATRNPVPIAEETRHDSDPAMPPTTKDGATTYTINWTADTPVYNLVVGAPTPSSVQVPGSVTVTATLTDAGSTERPARDAGDPVAGQTVSFYLFERIFICSAVTDANGVAACTGTVTSGAGALSVFAELILPNGSTLSSEPGGDSVDVSNNVVIQLASALAQPQVVNIVQRVTGTVQAGGLPAGGTVFFRVTNPDGLEVVGASCITLGKQAPVEANVIGVPIDLCTIRTGQQRRVPATEDLIVAYIQPDGTFWIELMRSTGGDTSVDIENVNAPTSSLNINGSPVPLAWSSPPPAKVLIGPKKAHRRCYEDAQVVARVLDAGGAPVADQPVTFGVTGSCVPRLESRVVVTDADGYAHLRLTSSEPGVAVVVAATVGANGSVLLSRPSHIVFEEEHHYEDREYEGRASAEHARDARPDSSDSEDEQHRQYAADAASLALAEARRMMSSKAA